MAISKRTRIAIVAASAPPLSSGGVASAHYNLFRALRRLGYDARLFTFFDNEASDKNDGYIYRHGVPEVLTHIIYRIVRSVLELLSQKPAYETAVILRSQLGAAKSMITLNRFDPNLVILSDHGAPGLMLKTKPGRKVLLVSHHNPMRFINQPGLPAASAFDAHLAVNLENYVLRKVDAVVCPSRYMKRWFRRTYAFRGKVHTLPNVIDSVFVDSIRAKTLTKNSRSKPKIVYLPSAATKIKGAEFLLPLVENLAETVPNIMFYVPGHVDPEFKASIQRVAKKSRIILPGQLSNAKHIALMKSCSFGISLALTENFSMAIFEAVYCGVPMIAFRTGGNEDVIVEDKNGYLIPAFDVKQMLVKARQLSSRSDLKKFKRRTEVYTRAHFDSEDITLKYIGIVGVK